MSSRASSHSNPGVAVRFATSLAGAGKILRERAADPAQMIVDRIKRFHRLMGQRRTAAILKALDNRLLQDIGVGRGDIHDISRRL